MRDPHVSNTYPLASANAIQKQLSNTGAQQMAGCRNESTRAFNDFQQNQRQ
jgi:hypothetical protein